MSNSCYKLICKNVLQIEDRVDDLEKLFPAKSIKITAGNSISDMSGGEAFIKPGGLIHFWSDGGISITSQQGSALINIEPNNITVDQAVAGAPDNPPDDETRPFIHFAQDGLYYWAPTASSWSLLPGGGGGGGDNWGGQVAVTDGTTIIGDGTPANPISSAIARQDDRIRPGTYNIVSEKVTLPLENWARILTGQNVVINIPNQSSPPDLHPATGDLAPAGDGFIRISELDENGVATGNTTNLDMRPSGESCNSIRLQSDGKHFAEDFGYRIARTWTSVILLAGAGTDILICDTLSLNQNTVLDSDSVIMFAQNGGIDMNGFTLELNCKTLNPNDRQVFYNVVINEDYPDRWDGSGSSLIGNFGGTYVRRPNWWGATTNDDAFGADITERERNNHAIAAAALSAADSFTGAVSPVIIELSQGGYAVHRTLRLDGKKVNLKGDGPSSAAQSGTNIVAHSDNNDVPFDTSHFIETFKYPGGTTPVIELGYEFINGIGTHVDVGMQCGVQNITVLCPIDAQAKPISGIMFEYGLQEYAKFSQFAVSGYSGYGVGGPEEQHLGHNEPTGDSAYPQLNSVIFEEFTILSPSPVAPDAIGIGLFGLNFEIRNGSVTHHNGTGAESILRTAPPIYVNTKQCLSLRNLHIECRPDPAALYNGACIAIDDISPGNVNSGSISISGVMGHFSSTVPLTTQTRTVYFNSNNVALHADSIKSNRIPDANHAPLEDVNRGVQSTGHTQAGITPGYVALYARQFNSDEAAYRVLTTDFGLL